MNICTESFNSTNSLRKLNIFNSFLHKSHSPSVSSSSTRVCVLTFLAALKYITSVSIHNQCNELIFPERVLLKFVRVLFKKNKTKVPHTRLQSERLDNLNLSENVI